MAVFLSYTNKEPYEVIDTINYHIDEIVADGTDSTSLDFYEKMDYFYIIFEKGEVHENVVVEASLTYELGISFEISEVDTIGNPIKWTTKINLGNIDASDETKIIMIAYRWRVINNIYITKPGTKGAIITVTADT